MGFLNTTVGSEFLGIIYFFRGLGWVLSFAFLIASIFLFFGLYLISQKGNESYSKHFLVRKSAPVMSPQRQRWEAIKALFISKNPTSWRVAIIDADSMLEDMITGMGYHGNTFGEKLKSMSRQSVPWLDAAWDVHLLRNKLAHEGSRYPLTERETYRAYKIYENILSGTGYLA